MVSETKRPLVLFSGGLDSTFLLQMTLWYGPCDVLYVRGGQHWDKVTKEHEARRKIIDTLNENYGYKVTREYEPSGRLSFSAIVDRKYSQPISWLMGALQVLNPDRHSKLLVGYVADDSFGFGRLSQHIEKVWESSQMLTHTKTPVPIEFPLADIGKLDILKQLDSRLVPLIWVCEDPIRKYHIDAEGPAKQESIVEVDSSADECTDTLDPALYQMLASPGISTDQAYDHVPCGECTPCRKIRSVMDEYRREKGETIFTTALKANRERMQSATKEGPPHELDSEYTSYRLVRDHHNH